MSYNLCYFIGKVFEKTKIIHYNIQTRGIFRSSLRGIPQKTDGDVLTGFSRAFATSFMCFPQDPFRLPHYLEKPLNFTRCP